MENLPAVEVLPPLNAMAVRENINLIQEVMREAMQGPTKENPEGVHYGIIPGTKKPTLLKPGAEKLSLVFRLRPIIESGRDIVQTELGNGHRELIVYCHIFNSAGQELATGIGSCSTMESKYRYRGGQKTPTGVIVPTEYWNLKKAGKMAEAQATLGGPGYGVAKIDGKWLICEIGEKMENPDIADTYNTVLKMAKKRAYVDGILSATAASDIFTQDVEDMPLPPQASAQAAPTAPQKEDTPETPQATAPAPMATPAQTQPAPADPSNGVRKISDKQASRFWALAHKGKKTAENVKDYLIDRIGSDSAKDIPADDYDSICAWAEDTK
jgi:hypothetical protein